MELETTAMAPTPRELPGLALSTWQWVAGGLLAAAFGWSYWPTLVELVEAWQTQPDYSHGWLVVPVAVYFLFSRRADCPPPKRDWAWVGLVLLVVSLAVRIAGSIWFLAPLAGWSIPLWVAGTCWFLGGWSLVRWCLPAIVFLVFMIPLPYRGETLLSGPLQAIATRISCFTLQFIGESAIREGNVILIDQHKIAVAEACSGLRIFMSIVALAFGYVLLVPNPMRVKIGLVLSLLPIALLTNAFRIVVTALLQKHLSGEAARHFSHDAAGWLMMPVAAALMAAAVFYSRRLIIEAEAVATRDILLSRSDDNH